MCLVEPVALGQTLSSNVAGQKQSKRENDAKLEAFNHTDNKAGERIRVILLTAEEHSEGVNLFNVRHPGTRPTERGDVPVCA